MWLGLRFFVLYPRDISDVRARAAVIDPGYRGIVAVFHGGIDVC
jgi:hypothetical protein